MTVSKDTQFDIVIVGGGLIGVSMAQSLRNHSARVALIDTHDISRPDILQPPWRAIALSDSSRRIFSTLGVWDMVAEHAYPVRRILVSEKDVFGVTHINAEHEGLDTVGSVIANTHLLQSLYQANNLSDHITLFPLSTVQTARRDQDSVHISLKRGDEAFDLSTRFLILSDGGTSSLASTLGFEQHKIDYQQTAVVFTAEVSEPYDGTVYDRFADGSLLVVLPLRSDTQRAFVWAMRNEEFARIKDFSDEDFMRLAQERLGSCVNICASRSQRFVYPLQCAYVSQPAADRVLLLGDAAHKVHPIAAQGFNLSLRDVAFLAEAIYDCKELATPEMLAAYCSSRAQDVKKVIRFTDGLARIVMNPSRTSAAVRGMGLAAFNMFPWARRKIVRSSLGLSAPYSRLASGIPLQK